MGSHSITCHPPQVNTPRRNPGQIGWHSIYLHKRHGRLSWPRWLVTYPDGLPARIMHTVTHPSTNPAVHGQESNLGLVDHKSNALTITLSSHLHTIKPPTYAQESGTRNVHMFLDRASFYLLANRTQLNLAEKNLHASDQNQNCEVWLVGCVFGRRREMCKFLVPNSSACVNPVQSYNCATCTNEQAAVFKGFEDNSDGLKKVNICYSAPSRLATAAALRYMVRTKQLRRTYLS